MKTCNSCENATVYAKGLCHRCYSTQRYEIRRGQELERKHGVNAGGCIHGGCKNWAKARGYCPKHYARLIKGKPLDDVPKEEGKIDAQSELRNAKQAYASAVGVAARMYWRNQITQLELL